MTKVLYLSDSEKFESGYVYESFKEELDLEGTTRDSLVEGRAFVKQDSVTSEILEDEKGCRIMIKVPVSLSACAYSEEQVTVIKDLYSVKNEIATSTESFSMSYVSGMKLIEGKVDGSLSLDENQPRVDKILFSDAASVTVTNSYVKDGEVTIEGIARGTVVYLNDEDGAMHSTQIDVPFELSDKFDVGEEDTLTVSAAIYDVDVAVKKGRDLFFDGRIKAACHASSERVSGVLSSATAGEEYPEKEFAMEVVFGHSGQDVWEIAKASRVKEDQLISQNPETIFPLENDASLILFYRQVQ